MTDSIARRVLTGAILLAAPLVLLIFLCVADVRVRALAVALALAAVGLAWWLAESLVRRIHALTVYVEDCSMPVAPPSRRPTMTTWAT